MLITQEYKRLNSILHDDVPGYGTSGYKKASLIEGVIEQAKAKTLLDYGAGKQTLKPVLSKLIDYRAYDPCIEGIDSPPEIADVVVCTDVMEHVEPECVDSVLAHVFSLTQKAAVFSICCEVGSRLLVNGKPAHCSVHPAGWWVSKLEQFGKVQIKPNITRAKELVCVVWVKGKT